MRTSNTRANALVSWAVLFASVWLGAACSGSDSQQTETSESGGAAGRNASHTGSAGGSQGTGGSNDTGGSSMGSGGARNTGGSANDAGGAADTGGSAGSGGSASSTGGAADTGGSAGSGGLGGGGDLPGWKLTWSDEFDAGNGSAPDASKWVYDVGWGQEGWGNNELEYYTDTRENSQVQDGSLVMTARTDNIESNMQCGSGACKYTSVRLKTLGKFDQQYGRFEARIKIPTGSGMWPAFWMMGNDFASAGWPNCGEIDIMENWGTDGTVIVGTPHDPGSNPEDGIPGHFSFPNIATVESDYHVYAVEWDADSIRWFVDDHAYHCVRSANAPESACAGAGDNQVSSAPHTWPFNHPFFMLLNLAIDSAPGNVPNANTKFPGTMLVDYVRVYQKQ